MPFQVRFTPRASDELRSFRKNELKQILEAIKTQLLHEPLSITRNRKKLRPNELAEWELRVGDFRVFYDVDELVTKHSKSVYDLLRQAMRQNLILRSEDGKEFILAEMDDFDREIELARQNKVLMKYLDERGKEKATISLEDLEKELGLAG